MLGIIKIEYLVGQVVPYLYSQHLGDQELKFRLRYPVKRCLKEKGKRERMRVSRKREGAKHNNMV